MSKIGKQTITIPEKVTVTITENEVKVAGTLGELTQEIPSHISVNIADGKVKVTRRGEAKPARAAHGLMRALINNMVNGVSNGWEKKLELVGTGYRARLEGKNLFMTLGYSHPITITPPQGITFAVDGQNIVIVKGADRQLVGQVAANVRSARPPEPYKGKGVKYVGEVIRRKAGKAAKA